MHCFLVQMKNTAKKEGGERQSNIVVLDNGNTYVQASRNVISGDNVAEWRKQITDFFNTLLDGEKSIDINTIDGDVLTISKDETANKARDNYKNENSKRVKLSNEEFRVKLNVEAHIDEIAETSLLNQSKIPDTKNHNFAKDGFTYRIAYFEDFDGQYYKITLSIGHNGNTATVYNVGKINKDSLPSATKKVAVVGSKPLGKLSNSTVSQLDTESQHYSMQHSKNNSSNRQYSVDSDNKKITVNMSDSERAEILKSKILVVPIYDGSADNVIAMNEQYLKSNKSAFIRNTLKRIGTEFGVFTKYNIEDIDLTVELSNNSIEKTANEYYAKKINVNELIKIYPILSETVKNAVGIESHGNRYFADYDTLYFHELLSGYIDGEYFVPIRFGIKEYKDKTAKIYVIISNEKIKTEVIAPATTDKTVKTGARSVIFSVPEIIKNVNSKDLLRYFPDEMINTKAMKIKYEGIAETIKHANDKNDKDYKKAIENGNVGDAKRMLKRAAEAKAYNNDDGWKMDHKAPNSTDGYSNSIDNIDKSYNSDGSIYSPQAVYYYGEGRSYDNKAISVIKSARNNPEKMIKVYRAVPTQIKDTRMRNGDWVAIVKEYAEEHGSRVLDDNFRIIENIVPAKYLFSNGDSINEWGYDNGNQNEVYKNTKNNVKLLEVTYDDNGNVIPLSERFNSENKDIRYSIDLEADSDDTMSNAEIQSEMNDIVARMQSGEITANDIIYIITKKHFTNGNTCVIINAVRNSVFEV